MTDIHEFKGNILCETSSVLGEGPTYDPDTDTVWWFNILGKELHELQLGTGKKRVHALPVMASVLARIDAERQLLATEQGLFIRNIASGELTFYLALEADKPENRSNDGRTHISGALWISTMGKRAEMQAGAIYHVAAGKVTKIFDGISIPNSICFSPDGSFGYFTDTRLSRLMRVLVDPATGLPAGEPIVLVDSTDEDPGGLDGSVCDADGYIWNARWGSGYVDRYSPDGLRIERYRVPAMQPSCPAFIGPNADRLVATTAWEGLDDEARATQPQAGALMELGITVKGLFDPAYVL